jgi:serine/threonine protein kinase
MARDILPLVRKALDGKYVIEREIGRGGAARVFKAQTLEGETVALKILHPQLAASVTADRFLREIKVVAQLEHPGVARMRDWGEDEWLLWYVMDFVEGPNLRHHLERARRTSVTDALHIANDLLGALAAAHAIGVVHRDVKPENILLAQSGAILVDFGIAKAVAEAGGERLTKSGFAVGTSLYMSPEQIAGDNDIDPRSDLYSLACVVYECLAGRPPFDDPFEELVLTKHRTTPPPNVLQFRPETPQPFAALLHRALEKARDQRWPSAAQMQEAVLAVARS